MTQKKLEQISKRWQKLLSLQDWEINIRLAEPDKILDRSLGQARINLKRKIAHIAVLDPKFLSSLESKRAEAEIEDTVVHELIHCLIEPYAPNDWDSLSGVLAEQSIDAIARAFVKLDKEKAPVKKKRARR